MEIQEINKTWNVIVALDNMDRDEVMKLIQEVSNNISDNVSFKFNDLLSFEGMTWVKDIITQLWEEGLDTNMIQLMLDPKWNDIPNTVANYLNKLDKSWLGNNTKLLTLMASGWYDMMKMAVDTRDKLWLGIDLLAVTALTTLGDKGTQRVFWDNVKHTVLKLAKDALGAGMDGIVCSPQEATMLRAVFWDNFLIVTPGIRMADNKVTNDDQNRIDTPAWAIRNWSTHLVIGRPITQAADKSAALLEILTSLEGVEKDSEANNDYVFEKLLYTWSMENLLKHIGAIYIRPENGAYVRLASGLLSNGYVNIGVAERNPYILERVSNELTQQLREDNIEANIVMWAQMGSVRLSSHLSKAMGIEESIYTEKSGDWDTSMELKRHDLDFTWKKIIISEDVITKATTTKKMIELVEQGGGEVVAITCLANRTWSDAVNNIPLYSTYSPDPFELHYDEQTPDDKKEGNLAIPTWSKIVEKPKDHRTELVESMR